MTLERIASPRPKILTRIPLTAAKTLTFKVSSAASLDTTVNVVIPSGNYYLRGDGQADDLIQVISKLLNTGIDTALGSPGNTEVSMYITSSNLFRFWFAGTYYSGNPHQDVEIDWTVNDGAELAAILGYDGTVKSTSTGTAAPKLESADRPGYFWIVDAEGHIQSDLIYDKQDNTVLVSKAPSGRVKQIHVGSIRRNHLQLQQLPQSLTYSDNTEYGSTPPYPLVKNAALECWYLKARTGEPFCVYRNGYVHVKRAITRGTADVTGDTLVLTDASRNWTVNQFAGKMLYIPVLGSIVAAKMYIVSNTATTLTIIDDIGDLAIPFDNSGYYIFDHDYREYVLDTAQMSAWEPSEPRKTIDFDINIPLIRYVA